MNRKNGLSTLDIRGQNKIIVVFKMRLQAKGKKIQMKEEKNILLTSQS